MRLRYLGIALLALASVGLRAEPDPDYLGELSA